jgi:uncharacterized membrane protein YfcA
MSIDPTVVLGSATVGLVVGTTGSGGGALMTPMLVFLFGVSPTTAISSDLVAAVLMRPAGALVHMTKRTVDYRLAGWLILGSVPAALSGAPVLRLLGTSKGLEVGIETLLGAALLAGAAAMVLRGAVDRPAGRDRGLRAPVGGIGGDVRPLPTVAVGALGGFMVAVTSVGSGSLMIVLLLFLDPALGADELVGTDLVQAVPLTSAAALGALVFGHVDPSLASSMALGGVPGVLVGSLASSRAPERYVRPVVAFVIFASGLKYLGLSAGLLFGILGGGLLVVAVRSLRGCGSRASGAR